jgi:transcriptional regulator with GAF, ATPase, and Fis domain
MVGSTHKSFASLQEKVDALARELSDSLIQQTATSEILRVIATSPTDLQPVLNTVAENAARICEANDALIYRFDGRGFKGVAEYGPLPGNLEKGPPIVDRRSVPGRAVIDRQTVHVRDLSAVPTADLRADFLRKHGTLTVLATPLLREGTPIGVIMIRRMEVRPFSDRQIALLETFADQAVIAIENVRLLQEIQEKNEQLEVANLKLRDLDRLKSDFVANVSHELRTPLTAIKGAVDLVLREVPGPLNEKQTHYLNRVRSNTQHLAGLINDLLDLSKIESEKIEVRSSRVSLAGLVHEVVETLRPVAAEKEVALEATICAPSILVWADRDKINQVLMNLIGNAIKFTPAQGRVEKGAFTGAHQLKKGKMELADGGTLFLDEVGDISPELQTKLLRFLQEREFERVGGAQQIRVDVRVIAATNRDLTSAMREGHFREDLYYRLNVIPIALPPLHERKEDIPVLAKYFFRRTAAETKKNVAGISQDAEAKLVAYEWPGNVRELANVIERAVVLGQGPEISVHDLPLSTAAPTEKNGCESLSYRQALEMAKRDVVLRALAQTQGNRAAAARLLGLHKTHLLNLIKSLRIE